MNPAKQNSPWLQFLECCFSLPLANTGMIRSTAEHTFAFLSKKNSTLLNIAGVLGDFYFFFRRSIKEQDLLAKNHFLAEARRRIFSAQRGLNLNPSFFSIKAWIMIYGSLPQLLVWCLSPLSVCLSSLAGLMGKHLLPEVKEIEALLHPILLKKDDERSQKTDSVFPCQH